MVSAWPSSMVASVAVLTTMHPRCSAAPLVSDISNSSRMAWRASVASVVIRVASSDQRVVYLRSAARNRVCLSPKVSYRLRRPMRSVRKAKDRDRRQVAPAPKNGVSRTG
ncbi:MAG: hypothetical protein QOE32_2416 [Pseudonocardiales bacterium]|nr:hypothetical protein [Pseudonocardiales bacterium]